MQIRVAVIFFPNLRNQLKSGSRFVAVGKSGIIPFHRAVSFFVFPPSPPCHLHPRSKLSSVCCRLGQCRLVLSFTSSCFISRGFCCFPRVLFLEMAVIATLKANRWKPFIFHPLKVPLNPNFEDQRLGEIHRDDHTRKLPPLY